MVTVSPLSFTNVYRYTGFPSTVPQSALVTPAFIDGAFLFSAPLLQATIKVASALAASINFTNFMMIDFYFLMMMNYFLTSPQPLSEGSGGIPALKISTQLLHFYPDNTKRIRP